MVGGLVLLVGAVSWWVAGLLSRTRSSLYLLDLPNQRSLHEVPTPRTGGLAILTGLVVGLLTLSVMRVLNGEGGRLTEWSTLLPWVLVPAAALAGLSFVDDRRGLPVWSRFTAQLVLASVVVSGGDLAIRTLSIPLVGTWELGTWSMVTAVGFLVWMTNLYNFMDGMDGFAGGMTVIGGAGLAGLGWASQHEALLVVPLLLAGASAGFLVHNFPPARIFMGDVGSVPIGFLFGALILWGCRDGIFDLWVPLMMFSPFVVDATVTLCRRSLRGERIWEAHRSHYYQRLVLSGWGHRRTVLSEYALMVLCVILALCYQFGNEPSRLGVLALWGLLLAGVMAGVSLAEGRRKQVVA
jgi:UDP-N-acetylmuramyl pentapeptide phosphotransferase/UDP-N-acetylglucosamine-1-phosphate transferase